MFVTRTFTLVSATFAAFGITPSFALPSASHPTHLQKRSQCAATLTVAESTANQLQSSYYDAFLGNYNSGELWTDANTIEDLHNLMLAAGTSTWDSTGAWSYIGRAATLTFGLTPWELFLGGSYDDAQWVILAFYKIADYANARGEDASPFMTAAGQIYDLVASQWDTTTCGGGVWWSSAHTYKNAVTNELFLYTSAAGYLRGQGDQYKTNANNVWNWLKNSGIRNSQGLWNDGLTSTNPNACTNNGQPTWTYNQGVIASGLSLLAQINNDPSLLDEAEITLDATIQYLTKNGILAESCDDPAPNGSTCDADQQIFKGVFMKHLQYYLDNANNSTRTAKYAPFIGAQESAVVHYGTSASGLIGNTWYAPSTGGSLFTPQSSASGLATHIVAAKYGPC